jgi:hypothetical protein
MATEDLTGTDKFVDDLVATNPVAADSVSDGDEHIRGVKNVLKNTLPNVTAAVTATAAQLNKTASTFTGADGSLAGASGMVTAPVATDNTKFLKGDGTWATPSGGGGGSSTLDGLTDVDTSAITLIDGAVLRYNGTASEWQNTNLGLSLTPTVTIPSTIYPSPTTVTITITNWSSYSSPAPWCEVENSSGTVVVASSAVTNNGDGTMTFASPSTAATYTLKVKVQDFGDLTSSIVSTSMVVSEAPSYSYRYFRVGSLGYGSAYLVTVEFYTSAGFTGTFYPPVMTSNSQTIGGVTYVLSGYTYNTTSYQLWKMTDISGWDPTTTGAWMLGASATQKSDGWVFDLGATRDIASARLKWYTYNTPNTYHASPFTVYGSSDGSSWTSINTVTMGSTNDGAYQDMLLGE